MSGAMDLRVKASQCPRDSYTGWETELKRKTINTCAKTRMEVSLKGL